MRDIEPTKSVAVESGHAGTGLRLSDPAPASADGAENDGFFASLLISAKIASIVCVVELGIAVFVSAVPALSSAGSIRIFYSILLAVISAPMILVWVVRPYIAERRRAYGRIAGMNQMLRREIDERLAAEEKLRAHEYELEMQIQEMDYVKQLVEEQASDAVGLAEDLAMQKQAVEESERRNEYLANHDMLTGLPNRRHFEQRLGEMKAEAASKDGAVTLIFVDLDNFKTVNDTLGHQRGDDILVQVANRLSESVRNSDFVARLGGDEFAVVLAHFTPASRDKLLEFAERMRTALAISVDGPAGVIPVSAALGIATYPADAADEHTLLKCADRAMYAAKAHGRNLVVFHRDLETVADPQ
jgi:diguanylate cyclase (GGDEF)-like protein